MRNKKSGKRNQPFSLKSNENRLKQESNRKQFYYYRFFLKLSVFTDTFKFVLFPYKYMKLTSKQTFKVIAFILRNPVFTQTQVFKATKISWGRMNEVVQWLVNKNFVERKSKEYELTDPAGLIALFPLYRDMDSLLLKKLSLRLSRKQIMNKLPKNTLLCLDSALEFYSSYWRSNRVCVYAEENSRQFKQILKDFQPFRGGNTLLLVFKPDTKLTSMKIKGFRVTDRLSTLIDLVCDNKSHYAKDLYKQLWGLKFEE